MVLSTSLSIFSYIFLWVFELCVVEEALYFLVNGGENPAICIFLLEAHGYNRGGLSRGE